MNEPLERRLRALRADLLERRARLLGMADRLGFSYVASPVLVEHHTLTAGEDQRTQPKTLRALIEEFEQSIAELDTILDPRRPRISEILGVRGEDRGAGRVEIVTACDASPQSFPVYRFRKVAP